MATDPFQLERFVAAQQRDYARALDELRCGRKQSHWMWYVFPQLQGLGRSATARHYAIGSIEEARAYLAHPVLGQRLRESCGVLAGLAGRDAAEVFGTVDELKLRSSLTLFARASGEPVFSDLLDKYFYGEADPLTLSILDVEE